MTETKRLGRGLEALLGPITLEQAERSGALRELPVDAIQANPYQPRGRIDETALKELVASIRSSGLLQPVVVRPRLGGYELIAGERRWRAVRELGWTKIPAIVKDVDDRTLLTLALVENLQRDDLSPIEQAVSYQRLMDEFQASQAEIARLVGKDRSTVANMLRLLRLPPEVRTMVDDGRLAEGHARALLGLSDSKEMVRLAREALAKAWSVREIEVRVRSDHQPRVKTRRTAPNRPLSHGQRRVEDALRKKLGTDVHLTSRRRGRGVISISYYSNDDLARLLELVLGEAFEG